MRKGEKTNLVQFIRKEDAYAWVCDCVPADIIDFKHYISPTAGFETWIIAHRKPATNLKELRNRDWKHALKKGNHDKTI